MTNISRITMCPSWSMACAGIIFMFCILCLSPVPDNVGKACMWIHKQQRKSHCLDAHEGLCVRTNELNSTSEQRLSFPEYVNKTNVHWLWQEPSVCVCEPGYNMHNGQCLEKIPILSDVDLAASIIGTILLCIGILVTELCARYCSKPYSSYVKNMRYGLNYLAFFIFIFFMIASIRYGMICSQY